MELIEQLRVAPILFPQAPLVKIGVADRHVVDKFRNRRALFISENVVDAARDFAQFIGLRLEEQPAVTHALINTVAGIIIPRAVTSFAVEALDVHFSDAAELHDTIEVDARLERVFDDV